MTNKQVKHRYAYILLGLLLLVFATASGWYILPAFADTKQYTSAITDLQKDSAFNENDYADNAEDYSVQVIQIAESTDGEVFVYTYQPCQKTTYIVATDVNMSLSDSADGTKLYSLTLINTSGVFGKYKVNDLTVSADTTRYYNITSIYREWIKGIDEETGNDNIKNAVAYAVGKLYIATTEKSGAVSYSCAYTETIEIINPYADYLEYSNGFKFFPDWCHSHYVAFSTDRQIDTLMEADVSYVRREASKSNGLGLDGKPHYGEAVTEIARLDGEQTGGNAADGWFAKKYEWERIQTVADFIATEDLKDATINALDGKQWVLRFVETTITLISGQGATSTFWTDISEVTVLRLKFVTDGKVYDLGAVSDKVTGDDKPGNNNTNEWAGLFEWLARITGIPEWAWILFAVLVVLAILLPVLSVLFPAFGQILLWIVKGIGAGVAWLFRGLWWLISAPFKGIAALVGKIKDRKDGGA